LPRVERAEAKDAQGQNVLRFKIELPRAYPSLTVVYSDTDDGQKQKRLIATSALKFGDALTLGATKIIPEDRGSCRIADGALEYVAARPSSPPSTPILRD
jgi:hypothetical protein